MTLQIDSPALIDSPDVTIDGSPILTESFVTVDQYAMATGTVITPGSPTEGKVIFALNAACAEIRNYVGQQLDKVLGDVVVLDGTGFRRVLLPELPVLAVSEVTLFVTDPNSGDIVPTPITDFLVRESGVLYRKKGWCLDVGNLKVTYDHGFDPIPSDLVNVAIQTARTAVTIAPGAIVSETIGGYSYSLGQVTLAGVEQFAKVLDNYVVQRIPVA